MKNLPHKRLRYGAGPAIAAVLLGVGTGAAWATDGVYLTGNGPFSSGMGGAAIAFGQDVVSAVDNPASLANVGARVDVYGVIMPVAADATFGSPNNTLSSRTTGLIPGFGINTQIAPQWTFGVAVTGAGAASDYGRPVVPDAGTAKASLAIINTSPTVTYKPLPNLSLGASLVLGFQQLRVNGIVAPGAGGSLQPVPSHGNANAFGIGAGLGVLWSPDPAVSIGASVFTKTRFQPLSGYKDDILASSSGHVDSPARYGIGVALRPLPGMTVAFDYVRINWSGAAGYNDPNSWNYHSQNVQRLGVAYELNANWTIRAGYSHANNHVDSDHTLANLYAPGISARATTLGATYTIDKNNLVTGALVYDIPSSITGTGVSTGTNIHARYQEFVIGYTRRF